MGKISAVISVVDEEKDLLLRPLASIKGIVDEIVIVDQTSGLDPTPLKDYPLKMYPHKRVQYVELVRNFGISKAKNEWILILDPDEEISPGLSQSLRKMAQKPKADYCRIPRKNIIFGKWMKHSRWWPDYNVRFFRKGYVSWNETIHAVPMTKGKGADLPEKESLAIIHHHYDSIEQYVERMNRYTSQHAKILVKDGYQFSWRDLIVKPANEFFSRYFFGEGYKDGVHGLAVSLLQAASELVVYLKTWPHSPKASRGKQADIKEVMELMNKVGRDLRYWEEDAKVKMGGGILHRIRRKLKV